MLERTTVRVVAYWALEPIRPNTSTGITVAILAQGICLEMQPNDRSHVLRFWRFSPTEAAFACMSLARARWQLKHVLSLNVSQRRIEDSLTLHDSATD